MPWRWLWAAVLTAIAPTLLWRRTHPLPMLAIAFGIGIGRGHRSPAADPQLVRDRRHAGARLRGVAVGLGPRHAGRRRPECWPRHLLASRVASARRASLTSSAAAVAGRHHQPRGRVPVAQPLPAPGSSTGCKLLEREQLARDLHDTVAHHVSAIAIQAQAGTAVAATDPDAAAACWGSSRVRHPARSDEMRSMVRIAASAARRSPSWHRRPGP